MAENISSNVLFHFTRSLQRLKGILENGFFPRYSPEYTLQPIDRQRHSRRVCPTCAIPMVCFCDLPISLIYKHYKRYGPYGIGVQKTWGLENGITPVTYAHRTALTTQPLVRLIKKALEAPDDLGIRDLFTLLACTKPYRGHAWRQGKRPQFEKTGCRFYDEREWRYVPPVPASELLLDRKVYGNKPKLGSFHTELERFALRVHPDFIMYLILPAKRDDEASVMQFHDYLMRLYKTRYGRKAATLVTTTILTSDCLIQDV